MMIDVHCHLSSPLFQKDIKEIINMAVDEGITVIISVGEEYEDNLRLLDLGSKYPLIKIGLGHHPEIIDAVSAEKTMRLIEDNYTAITCIGEVGLDYFKVRDHKERDIQRGIFHGFISLGNRLNLPLNVHSRSAGDQTIEVLGSHVPKLKINVNLHAFSGKGGKARQAAEEYGYYFSIPGSIYYSSQKQKLARLIPDDKLLLETDSPVMPPVRGEVNYPSNLPLILKEVSRIRREDYNSLRDKVYKNSLKYLNFKHIEREIP